MKHLLTASLAVALACLTPGLIPDTAAAADVDELLRLGDAGATTPEEDQAPLMAYA